MAIVSNRCFNAYVELQVTTFLLRFRRSTGHQLPQMIPSSPSILSNHIIKGLYLEGEYKGMTIMKC